MGFEWRIWVFGRVLECVLEKVLEGKSQGLKDCENAMQRNNDYTSKKYIRKMILSLWRESRQG